MKVLQDGFKGVSLKNTNKNYIENIGLNILPNLNEQRDIVERLDKINETTQRHKKVINHLNILIKARFVEMFGDINNYKVNIDVKKFKDICTVHQGLQIPISDRKKEPGPNRYKYITIQYLNGKKEEEQNIFINLFTSKRS